MLGNDKTKIILLGVVTALVIIPTIFILSQKQKKGTSPKTTAPPMTSIFDGSDNCVPAKNTPPRKLSHLALGITNFYDKYNGLFIDKWKCLTGETVIINQNYGISGEIMRGMIRGDLKPDVVSLSNPTEMDNVATVSGMVSPKWRESFPFDSSPYFSSVVFLVRKGNPHQVTDWGDLIKPGLTLLASNPQMCGGGRWVYTAALGYSMGPNGPLSSEGKNYLSQFYSNFPILYHDQGEAGTAFVANKVGDVLVTYEKFALLQKKNNKPVEVVVPSKTVEIDMPVAVVEKYAEKDGVSDIAKAYIDGLYNPNVQRLVAQDLLRPRLPESSSDLLTQFPTVNLFTRSDVFGNGNNIENAHLGSGGFFDSILLAHPIRPAGK